MSADEDFQREYRNTIGMFATGVTVIVAQKDGETRGMTANAVTSVSLEPTLLLFCPAKKSRMAEFCGEGEPFTVSILSSEQEATSNHFAGADMAPSHELIEWRQGNGVPRVDGCLAALACTTTEMLDGGDHWIVIGEVTALHREDEPGDPLLFYRGGYRELAPE